MGRVYAEYLGNKLPRIENGAVKLKEGDEKSLCFAVNTAEYCSSNTEALSTTIKNYVDADTKVDMSAEQERFQALVAKVCLFVCLFFFSHDCIGNASSCSKFGN